MWGHLESLLATEVNYSTAPEKQLEGNSKLKVLLDITR
jgi:hypothetical protein